MSEKVDKVDKDVQEEHEMKFYSVGDEQGIIHWLGKGCAEKEKWSNPVLGSKAPVRVLASSCDVGELWMVTDWKFDSKEHDYQSKDMARSWVAVDFKNWEVCPAVYSMAHDNKTRPNFLRSWRLQGSNDLKHWTALDTRTNDQALCEKEPWVAYATPELSSYYQYIRILMEANGNTHKNNVLTLNCFELYGKVRRRKIPEVPKPVKANKPKGKHSDPKGIKDLMDALEGGKLPFGRGANAGAGRGSSGEHFRGGGALPPWGAGGRGAVGMVKGGKGAKGGKGGIVSARGDGFPVGGRGRGGAVHAAPPTAQRQPAPQKSLECPTKEGTSSFAFEKLSDHKGILFYLGCDEGKGTWKNPVKSGAVSVTASSTKQGVPAMVGDHTFADQVFFTDDKPDSWVDITFKKGHSVIPTKYVFAHRKGIRAYYPRTWEFQGSKDGKVFKTLATHKDDTSFDVQKPVAAFDVNATTTAYSTFRIKLAEKGNSKDTSALVVSCFEVYGALKK